MAIQVFKPTAVPDVPDPLLKEFNKRLERARLDRSRHEARLSDCYKFIAPWRHKFNSSQPGDQYDDTFDETSQVIAEDFSADMLDTFTPRKNDWIEIQPAITLGQGEARIIADALKQFQTIIFKEMARSNLYEALQAAYLDLGPGTMNLVITDIGATEPIHCEAVPLTEKWITRGPFGRVDGHFRGRRYRREEIPVLWPDAKAQDGKRWDEDPEVEIDVVEGCWRDWSDRGNEVYQYAVQGNSKIIYRIKWKGTGSCPFVTARWSKDPTTAWGIGPTMRVLNAMRTLDHVRYVDLKNYDKYVDPVVSYEDDGVMNVDNGAEPGMWIPRAIGSKAPESIESKAQFDVAVFERDQLRSLIRRAHYQDEPEQLGKTPPSATQWADEKARRARRMGTPATTLVEELLYPLFRRFAYLLTQRGVLPPVELNGKVVALEPISPLLRAMEQEEIVRIDKFLEMIGVRFGPQMTIVVVDAMKASRYLAEKFGIPLEILRSPQELAGAMQQLAPIIQNFAGGGGGGGQMAPPPVGALGPPQ